MREVRTRSCRILAGFASAMLLLGLISCGGGGATTGSSPVTPPAAPSISLVPNTIDFGDVAIGTSVSRTSTLSNTGQAPLSLGAITAGGDFSVTDDCGVTLLADASCTVMVKFAPTVVGTRSGSVAISDNATGSPHQVTLTGRGVNTPIPAVSLSQSTMNFGNQTVNTSSAGRTIELTNTGNATMSIGSIVVNGDFTQTNNCGQSLTAGGACSITVVFIPKAIGARTGTLTISDNASGSPHRVSLSGTGVGTGQLSATPSSVSFGTVSVGKTSSQTIQLTNTGTGSLTISSASTTGPGFSFNGLALPTTLGVSQRVAFNVSFAPTNAGSASGSVVLRVTGSSSETTVPLSGTAVTPIIHSVTLVWNASTSAVIGYNVYRSPQASGPYNRINGSMVTGTTFKDSSVVAGQTYWYVVTSVANGNVESGYSSAIGAVIPAP